MFDIKIPGLYGLVDSGQYILKDGFDAAFYAVLIVTALMGIFSAVLLPTVGADQVWFLVCRCCWQT